MAVFYEQLDEDSNGLSITPIYNALLASISLRKEMLREGMSVYDISKVALIDTQEVTLAHEERREPLLRRGKLSLQP
jgi:hypothetical protein